MKNNLLNSIGAFEAKAHLSQLLERVAQGEEFVITRHNHPVARLIPTERCSHLDIAEIFQRLAAMRETIRNRKIKDRTSVKTLIDEGRRF